MAENEGLTLIWTQDRPSGRIYPPAWDGDAGYDLSVAVQTLVPPGRSRPTAVECGISIALPHNVSALVYPRSSTCRRGLLVAETLIDSGYRGPLYVMVWNLDRSLTVVLQEGERIAQLLLLPVLHVQLTQALTLPESQRGARGFGSSNALRPLPTGDSVAKE